MTVDQRKSKPGARNARAGLSVVGRASLEDGSELRPATTSALIYQTLRSEIVSLLRRPGEPVLEKDIGAQFGVSRTPVREAILRLAAEKLVEIFPQSGTFVARIPIDDLPEAIVIRKALEEVTMRAAAERVSRAQVTGLRANLDLQREAIAAGNHDAFRGADDAFHADIAKIAGYPGIWADRAIVEDPGRPLLPSHAAQARPDGAAVARAYRHLPCDQGSRRRSGGGGPARPYRPAS